MSEINWHTLDDVPRDGAPVLMWDSLNNSAVSVIHLDEATLTARGCDGSCPWSEVKEGEPRYFPDSIFSHWTRDFSLT